MLIEALGKRSTHEKDIADQSPHGSRMQPDAANDHYRQTGSDNLVLRSNRLG
jgi:hypothetical protein